MITEIKIVLAVFLIFCVFISIGILVLIEWQKPKKNPFILEETEQSPSDSSCSSSSYSSSIDMMGISLFLFGASTFYAIIWHAYHWLAHGKWLSYKFYQLIHWTSYFTDIHSFTHWIGVQKILISIATLDHCLFFVLATFLLCIFFGFFE